MTRQRDAATDADGPRLRRDAEQNRERVLAAAVTAMLRDGRQVPMAAIAAEAGVGIGTLYRKYPNREALLDELTERAFALLAENAAAVLAGGGTGLDQLSRWWDRVIADCDQLVLPLHGGPPVITDRGARERDRLHAALRQILRTGSHDGTIRDDLTLGEMIQFGAMLATPVGELSRWRRIARRHKEIHLDGLAGPALRSRP